MFVAFYIYVLFRSRRDRIRTCDLIVPNDARYQTVLHPDKKVLYAYLGKIASKICVFYV